MKKTITEITEKFDKDGKMIERVTKTTTEETAYSYPTYPYYPEWIYRPHTYPITLNGTGANGSYADSTTHTNKDCVTTTTNASNSIL